MLRFAFALCVLLLAICSPRPVVAAAPPADTLDSPAAPSSPGLLAYAEGLDLIERGQFADAVAPLSKAIDAEEENVAYYVARGVAQTLNQQPAAGQKDLERAYRLDPKYVEAGRMLAFAIRCQGDQLTPPKYYSHASTDPWDKFLRETGDGYGAPKFGSGNFPDQVRAEMRQRQANALKQFPQIGQRFAAMYKQGPELAKALLPRGIARAKAGEFAAAERDLYAALVANPDDRTALYWHAVSLAGQNRFEPARIELSIVLSWKTALPEGYANRARAAALVGDLSRAEHDIAIARALDPKDERKSIAPAEAALAEARKSQPAASARECFDALLNAATKDAKSDELTRLAFDLVRVSNGGRLRGDEAYQERRRQLTWALLADPKNPQHLSDLGRFLDQEADVRGECVEPNGLWLSYRSQSQRLKEAELAYAGQLFAQALAIDPKHIPAMVGQASLKIRQRLWADAETILTNALAIRDDEPELLQLMSQVQQVAAGQKSARAANLRQVQTWTEYGYSVNWHYTRYPSQAELAAADEYDRQAARLIELSKRSMAKALKACANTAKGDYLQGTVLWNEGNLDGAKQSIESAIKRDPFYREAYAALANIYAKLNMVDASIEAQTSGMNLDQTTAAPWLSRAWAKIVNNAWKTTKAALDKAIALDRADSRILGYLGAMAKEQGQDAQAIACYRAALAIEDARAQMRGGPSSAGTWAVNDFGRAMILRIRLGDAIAEKDPAAAAQLYLANVAFEEAIGEWRFGQRMQTAMLPDPQQDVKIAPSPPIAAAVLRQSRALAAVALMRSGRSADALSHFKMLSTYEHRLRGGGTAYLEDPNRASSAYVALWAARAFLAAGDMPQARTWAYKAQTYYLTSPEGRKDPNRAEFEKLNEEMNREPARPRRPVREDW